MISKSYTNLLDLAAGNFSSLTISGAADRTRHIPRVTTVPAILTELNDDDKSTGVQSSQSQERIIIVANQLPVNARRKTDNSGWNFTWNDESLLLQLRRGLPEDKEVIYVGSLRAEVDVKDEENVSHFLLENFKCVPTFISQNNYENFYDKFCKQMLWPLLHYMLPFSADHHSRRFDKSLWEYYITANKTFAQKVIEVIDPDQDYVWIHDYHLMVMPTFLRRRFIRLRMGFFLHSPFPTSEIYRTLPVREEILKALLNCDLIGFHTFDYARHFLSCCSRMLGVECHSRRGSISLDYFGRNVGIKILPVGVDMGQIESVLRLSDHELKFNELKIEFEGKIVLLGVDDMDVFKGINLKLLAFEHMLKRHSKWQGKVVLVQIANPVRRRGKEVSEVEDEIKQSCERINKAFGCSGYSPVVFFDRDVCYAERIAYYRIAECALVTAVRDGMNLIAYEYVVSREGINDSCTVVEGPRKSMLVVSEFIGCSPSLSGAIRVNPWNVEMTGEAINEAISLSDQEKQLRHKKHYRYVSTHDVAYWSRSFMQDMERACKDHFRRKCWGVGLGFGFRVVAVDPNFRKLDIDFIVSDYENAENRAILLDYDGTLVPQTSINKKPGEEVITIINALCADRRNVVFIVSGRGRENLQKWLYPCEKLRLAAEHGYFIRWSSVEEWETSNKSINFDWMQIAEPVMKLYTESTDGSYIEMKESAIVWHYQDADHGFGSAQAKEMLDHLESVLANEPVSVKSGQFIVEVKPQGVTKGLVAEKILSSMTENGRLADFVLCVGDDRSDEDMFEGISDIVSRNLVAPTTSLFACTVGQKPSKAKYYLDDTNDVIGMLKALAEASKQSSSIQELSEKTTSVKQ